MTRRRIKNGQKRRKGSNAHETDDENSENVANPCAKKQKTYGVKSAPSPQIAHAAVQCCPSGSDFRKLRTCAEENVNLALRAMISDKDGDRLIHVAVAQENTELVKQLCTAMLNANISLDVTNHLRQTPLHVAVILGSLTMVQLLLDYDSSLLLRDRRGHSLLHLAIKTGANTDVLKHVLSHRDADRIRDSLDYEGYSPLHYAVFKLNTEAVYCLYEGRTYIDITDGKSGRSPLVHAVLKQDEEMVRTLLQCGASKDSTDFSGRSVTDTALLVGNRAVLELLQHGTEESGIRRRRRTSSARNKTD